MAENGLFGSYGPQRAEIVDFGPQTPNWPKTTVLVKMTTFGSFWPYPAKRPFWASEAQYGQNRPFWPIFGLFGLYPAPEAQIGPNRPFIGKIGHL